MAAMQIWRSKLGNDFPRAQIERDEKKTMAELDRLRAAVAEGGRLAFRPFGFRISHATAAAAANVVAAFLVSMLLEHYSADA